MRGQLSAIFARKTRADWCAVLENTDVCFAPVMSLAEAPGHPHNVARGTFVDSGGVAQPAPAPRFSATPTSIQWPPAAIAKDVKTAIAAWRQERGPAAGAG
jgi:alpha-methylacyl-CoA racemase